MPFTINRNNKTAVNLRIAKLLTGFRGLYGNPHVPAEGEGMIGTVTNQTGQDQNPELLTGRMETRSDDRPYVENLDEWKDRIPKRGIKKWVRRFRIVKHYLNLLTMLRTDTDIPLVNRIERLRMGRDFTPTERAEILENINRQRLDAFHRERANRGGKLIINSLANLGFANVHVNAKGGTKFLKTIVFDRVEYSPLIYRYHVDAKRLPYKISIGDLYADGVCTTLSASVEHPVRAKIEQIGTYVTGLWYEIEIAATLGIPNLCKFSDLLPLIPQSAPPLAFVVGYGENKRPYVRGLEEMPHFLGGGQTSGGKSNFMHAMICAFLARNSPDDVRFLMIDMKFNGIELDRYKGIPHMVTDVEELPEGIAGTPAEAIKVLRWIVKEGNRRGQMFKAEGTQNLKAWNNKHRTRKLPRIVCVSDELALLRLDPEHGNEAYHLIREISSVARAAGIHLVTFTQSSNKRVIDEMIKVNFPGRICFSVPDASSSILFVGDGSAINLMPAGRARFKHGTDNFLAQTPLIQVSEIDEIVKNAKAGRTTMKLSKTVVTPEEVIEWAMEYNNSSLAVADVYNKFSTRIEQAAVIRLLKEMEGQIFDLGDRSYQVLPGAGKRPRVVVKIDANAASLAPKTQNITQNATDSTVTRDADGTETGE
jgi:hypothetical protein